MGMGDDIPSRNIPMLRFWLFFEVGVCVRAHVDLTIHSNQHRSVTYQTDQKGFIKTIGYSQGRDKLVGAGL